MNREHRIEAIVGRCRWAKSRDEVLAVIPDLIADAPLSDPSASTGSKLNIAGMDALWTPLVQTLTTAVETSGRIDGLVHARVDEAMSDRLVSGLVPILYQTRCSPDPVRALPVLGLVSLLHKALQDDESWIARLPKPVADRWEAVRQRCAEASPSEEGAMLARMADAVTARVTAALSVARSADIHSTGLVRRLVTSRLPWILPLDSSVSVDARVAGVLETSMDDGLLQVIQEASMVAWRDSRNRLGTRKERPIDLVLAQASKGIVNGTAATFSPDVGPLLVRLLPSLVTVRSLKGEVSDSNRAVRLLEDAAARTVSGAWADVLVAIREWDVLNAVVQGIEPCFSTGVRETDLKVLFSVPRNDPDHPFVVVAARTGDIISAAGGSSRVRQAVRTIWADLVRTTPNTVGTWMADHGVAIFDDATDALKFAQAVGQRLPGGDGLIAVSDGGQPIAVQPGLRIGLGIAQGPVLGGRHGFETWLDGPTVCRAMDLSGGGPVDLPVGDPLGIRRVTVSGQGLVSSGILMQRGCMEAALSRFDGAIHRRGSQERVAGVKEDFQCYPVEAWWAEGETVTMFLPLGTGGGAVEVLSFGLHMFRDVFVRDKDLGSANSGDSLVDVVIEDPEDDASGPKDWDPFASMPKEQTSEPDPFSGVETGDGNPRLELRDNWTEIGFGDDDGS